MQNSRLNFLGLAHVPEVFTKISASTAGNVHFALVLVVANGAFPFVVIVYYNFAVETANVAIVALGVEFGVLNVVVNKLHNIGKRGKVVAHIGNFNVRNCSARRNLLELAFELEL